jgi:ubiquinone/menaquinone biosynthesis C-methylase UbiE
MQVCYEKQDFYTYVLRELLAEQLLTKSSTILVVCGGQTDYKTLRSLRFENVTISNLDNRRLNTEEKHPFAPYEWRYEDAENLSYPENSFDFVMVHSGLHHLHCPEKGITEMYRVASSGVIGFEPNKNLFTSLGVRMGFGQEYETAAVFRHNCIHGGVANTRIPNYVHRFSNADIVRTVQTFAPVARHRYRFWYTTRIPGRLYRMKKRYVRPLVRMSESLLRAMGRTFPFFANNMAFFISKPVMPLDLFPWLTVIEGEIVPNQEYLEQVYEPF